MRVKFNYQNYHFSLTTDVLEKIIEYKQIDNKFEAGGMLIGSILLDSNEIEINDFTEPIDEDERTRIGFKRSNIHNKLLRKKWEESNCTKLYLGEWHTHPQNIPSPSYVDMNSWEKLLYTSNTECEYLIFIIIGLISMEIWIGDKKKKKLERGGYYRY